MRRACSLSLAVALVALAPASAQPPAPKTATDDANAVLAETVGLLVYQTYLNIGLLADARAEGLYEAGELTQLLGSVVVPLEKVEAQLGKVAKLKLPKEDAAAVARMQKLAGLLRQQGKSLEKFWETGVADHGKKYEAVRQEVWNELKELLDLDPKVGTAPEPKPAGKKP
jgi:hypothetical protein